MNKYIALLRGVNISGKNKIPMKILKLCFEENKFADVSTYINSGNVIFSTDIKNENEITQKIKDIILNKFNLDIPVVVISIDCLVDIFKNAPKWWGTDNNGIYDNAIFVIPPTSIEEVFTVIGEPKTEYEKVISYKDVIYWSAILKTFSKTKWSKIASSSVNNKVTIRNANTIKKLLEIAKK